MKLKIKEPLIRTRRARCNITMLPNSTDWYNLLATMAARTSWRIDQDYNIYTADTRHVSDDGHGTIVCWHFDQQQTTRYDIFVSAKCDVRLIAIASSTITDPLIFRLRGALWRQDSVHQRLDVRHQLPALQPRRGVRRDHPARLQQTGLSRH